MQAFTEATAAINRVREALTKFREAEAAGLGADRAVKEALGDLMDRGILAGMSFAELKDQVNDARSALTHYREAVAAGMPVDLAEIAVINDTALAFEGEAVAADGAAVSTDAASSAAAGGVAGFVGMAISVLAVVAAVQLLIPPLLIAAGALAVLVSFAVAGAGMIALLGAIGLAIGALGAGTLALGIAGMGGTGAAAQVAKTQAAVAAAQAQLARAEASGGAGGAAHALRVAQAQEKLAAAQQSYAAALQATHSPISVFMAHLNEMAQDFTKAAEPFAKLIIQFGDKALPAIEKLGMSLLAWFGHRIPGILSQISRLFKDLAPDFQAFGKFLGDLFDRNEGKIAPMAEAFIRFGLSLSTGLLKTLESLSNWFMERLPTYGPVVKDILGRIGGAFLAVVAAVGRFADYVVKNWPTWVKEISDAWNSGPAQAFQQAWETDLPSLKKSFEDIMKQAPVWVPIIGTLATAFLDFATAILAAVSAGEQLIALIQKNPWLTGPLGIVQGALGSGSGGGTTGNAGHGRERHPSGSPKTASRITVNVNGAQNPTATARAVARQLQRLTAV